jgi:hypothetical protein
MARKQLDLAKADKVDEFNDICALTNPTLKKHYLKDFAENCDSAAVHLKAAALPGQKYHVIIPVNSLNDNEVFAPNYENGTKLALIRYPHGGTFEIPILTVNNKNQLAKKIIGTDSIDAVGINKNIADRLSGADFDGDTVMAIPTHDPQGRVKITSTKPLEGLIGFDPKKEYAEVPGMKYMKDPKTGKDNTQNEMGRISNLITDMTLGGADEKELARAVRHSMVVIDAGKHKLNYKQSEIDNNIAALRKKYQPKYDEDGNLIGAGGAATIFASPEFVSAMGADIVAPGTTNVPGVYSPKDIEDIAANGRVKMFRGTPIVELRQSFLDENNDKVMIHPQFAYVLPSGREKVVKVLLEGATQMYDHVNPDQSVEIHTYKKVGVGILAFNNWGIYKNDQINADNWYDNRLGLNVAKV